MFERPIVVLDFETTGLSPEMGDRVTEVAALRIADGGIVDRFVSLVNCGVRIPPFITSLTGITQGMVDSAPPAYVVIPELIDFIGSDSLAAHNASFDEKFLRAEGARLGKDCRHSGSVCSVKLARRIFPGLPSYKLGELSRSLGIRSRLSRHRAEGDAEVTAELMLHIGRHLHKSFGLQRVEPSLLAEVNATSARRCYELLRKAQTSRGVMPVDVPEILGLDGRPCDSRIVVPVSVEICRYLEDKLFEAVTRDPDMMYRISPYEFEQFIAELLHRKGYCVELTPSSRDGGVDIYASMSTDLGSQLFLVECKRYAKEMPVKVDVVRALYGVVQEKRATGGVIVTTSTFTKGAKEFQSRLQNQMTLRDHTEVRDWIPKVTH